MFENEPVDPRVQEELDELNLAAEQINVKEVQLEESRARFRRYMAECSSRLEALCRRLSPAVDKARPYYSAWATCAASHQKATDAALRFERATAMHSSAKDMVRTAEQGSAGLESDGTAKTQEEARRLDASWQEMLNQANLKVNAAEQERMAAEMEHARTSAEFAQAQSALLKLQRELKKHISKSKPYFEKKSEYNSAMEKQKEQIEKNERAVNSAKERYSRALRSLEAISESVHAQRARAALGCRESGVGAENPDPAPGDPSPREVKQAGFDADVEDEPQFEKISFVAPEATKASVVSDENNIKPRANTEPSPASPTHGVSSGRTRSRSARLKGGALPLVASMQTCAKQQDPPSVSPTPSLLYAASPAGLGHVREWRGVVQVPRLSVQDPEPFDESRNLSKLRITDGTTGSLHEGLSATAQVESTRLAEEDHKSVDACSLDAMSLPEVDSTFIRAIMNSPRELSEASDTSDSRVSPKHDDEQAIWDIADAKNVAEAGSLDYTSQTAVD